MVHFFILFRSPLKHLEGFLKASKVFIEHSNVPQRVVKTHSHTKFHSDKIFVDTRMNHHSRFGDNIDFCGL